VIAAVRQLVLIANDDLIAGILNRNGLVTGYGNRWTRERVTSLRSHHGIAVYKPAADINDHLGDACWRVGRVLEPRFQWSHARDLKPEPEDLVKIEAKLKSGLPDDPLVEQFAPKAD
jgi:hypothetical protein